MSNLLRPVAALLTGTAILLLGNGLHGLVVPVRADSESFSQMAIGVLGSSYYLGLLLGCLLNPRLIARVGHIRAFAAFSALVAAVPLLHALYVHVFFWSILRFLTGVCFAGLYMGIESWLSQSTEGHSRGRILAAYTIINLVAVPVGMQLMHLVGHSGFEPFAVISIFYSLAAVPVALTRRNAPALIPTARLGLNRLIRVSPTAAVGCLCAGLANSAIWTMITVYGKAVGIGPEGSATLLSVIVLAGAAGQWTVGAISDRIGRQPVLLVMSVLGAVIGGVLFHWAPPELSWTLALGGGIGLCAFSIYPLCLAHANDRISKKRSVEVSGGLLLLFSITAIVGPSAAAVLIQLFGGGALFLVTAFAHGFLALVLIVRLKKSGARNKATENFVPMPRTSPAVFQLDPRANSDKS
ncbi:MAG: MFS transporter [Bdellovibrionales bacterium]